MAEAALTTLGAIADVAGLVSLFSDQFTPQEVEGTGISIKVGLSSRDGVTGQGGLITAAYAYDYTNAYLGSASGGSVDAGGVIDMTIDQEYPDRQGRYVSIAASDQDDVCVLLVTVNNNDGLYKGTWNGDIGALCGQAVYHGNGESIGNIGDPPQPWFPQCTWFGQSQEGHGAKAHSWKFNTIAYGSSSNETLTDNAVCDSTIFLPDVAAIQGQPGGDDVPDKRSTPALELPLTRPDWMEETLIVSKREQHTAEQLCTQGMSWGPDFVDAHGFYCDMKTKTLLSLCTGTTTTDCVTLSDDSKTISKRSNMARRNVENVHNAYSKVRHWGGN